MKVGFVRGAFLNTYEGQNYEFLGKRVEFTGVASLSPIHKRLSFPIIHLPSLCDIHVPNFVANRILGDVQNLFGLEKLAGKFDLFHTADSHYYYSYQLAKMRQLGKIRCLISTSWETIPFNNESVFRKKYIKRFTMRYIDHFLCYTERARECLITEGVKSQKISVIRLGVDLNRFTTQNVKRKIVRVLFAGRLIKEKGIDDIKHAIKSINNAELVIAGGVPYEKMPEMYQSADIFVMPSKRTKTWEEQYGVSIVEAMASGLPIVAYSSGAIAEVLGNTGVLVDESNIAQFTERLEQLVNDRSLREKLGRMGRKRAELLFDARKTAKQIEKLYETVYRYSYKK